MRRLERSGATTVFEVIRDAPNVTPAPPEFLPPIRGVESGGPGGLGGNNLFGSTPRATLIVDDVARLSTLPNNAIQSLFDVEQVEVFRGPQTTVRGANAFAGAYVLRTRDPSFEPEVRAYVAGSADADRADDLLAGLEQHAAVEWNAVLEGARPCRRGRCRA